MQTRAIPADDVALVSALEAADLPTTDLNEAGRTYFAIEDKGKSVGFGGYELYGEDALLRSVVVLPELRGQGLGRHVTDAVLGQAHHAGARRAWLLTTTAEEFFARQGFVRVERSEAPASILGTRQATTICASATMLTRSLMPHG